MNKKHQIQQPENLDSAMMIDGL